MNIVQYKCELMTCKFMLTSSLRNEKEKSSSFSKKF